MSIVSSNVRRENPALAPRVNILELSAEDRESFYGPLGSVALGPDEPEDMMCVLPWVDAEGFLHGMAPAEERQVMTAMERVRDAYLSDPTADRRHTRAVVVRAGRDALRRVLADRPAPSAEVDPGDLESDPETWGPEWDADCWELGPEPGQADAFEPSEADRRWWVEFQASASARPYNRRRPAPHSDRDVARVGAVG